MSRIAATFERLRGEHRQALVPFVVAGDPDLAVTEQAVATLIRAGADMVELGVPFSDPVADGPINQRAYQRALAGGITVRDVIELVGRRDLLPPSCSSPTTIPLFSLAWNGSAWMPRWPAWTAS